MSAKPQMKEIADDIVERNFDFRNEEAGAKLNHNRITRNLGGLLWQHLRGKTCESFTSDMAVKVKTVDGKDYYYPDIVVVCGDDEDKNFSETKDGKSQAENPVLIIEVLSIGSQKDLSTKFEEYKQINSFIEYIVIYQDSPKLIYHLKSKENGWIKREIEGENEFLFCG